MPVDGFFVAAQVKEFKKHINLRVSKACQPAAGELFLSMWGHEEAVLIFSIDPRAFSFHLSRRPFPFRESQTPFGATVNKYLAGAKLIDIEQLPLERVVIFKWENFHKYHGLSYSHLIWEGMGKYSNLILVEPRQNEIIDVMKKVSPDINRVRTLLPGETYRLPPAQEDKLNASAISAPDWNFLLSQANTPVDPGIWLTWNFFGVSALLGREIAIRAGLSGEVIPAQLPGESREKWFAALTSLLEAAVSGEIEPCIYRKDSEMEFYFTRLRHLEPAGYVRTPYPTLSDLLDEVTGNEMRLRSIRENKHALTQVLHTQLNRARKKLKLQKDELEQAENGEEYKEKAELILANLSSLSKGADRVCLFDFNHEKEVQIRLDPALSPVENAQKYFKKYQKAKKAMIALAGQLTKTKEELDYLESLELALDRADDERTISELKEEFMEAGLIGKNLKKSKNPRPAYKPYKFISPENAEIYVGKNNLQNDWLTFHLAKPNDLWFHIKDYPGSHVILKTGQREANSADILAAANLAVYFSKARGSTKVRIDYTPRKNVKKPPGAKPGKVIYDSFQTIITDPDEKLLRFFNLE